MSGTGDHYKVLGLNKNATKDEIKEAFRKLAIKYHPDKHSQSPKPVRENATLRFKLASEAYEVLSDDRKRADYNIRSRSTGSYGYNRYSYNNSYNNNSYRWNGKAYQARYTKRPPGSGSGSGSGSSDFVSRFEFALRLLTTRAFLLNLGFAGALVGGMFLIDSSMNSIWKTQNSGMNERYIIENTAENLLLQPQSYTHASQTKQNELHPGSSRDNTSALQPRTKIPEKQLTMQEASEYITQAFLVRADTEIPQHQHKKSFEEALDSIEKTKGSQKSPREAYGSIERVRAYKAMKSTEKAKAISENNRRIH